MTPIELGAHTLVIRSYLLTVVSDLHADASQLLVLDAADLGRPPVATVHLPRRVVAGIHGSWISDNRHP